MLLSACGRSSGPESSDASPPPTAPAPEPDPAALEPAVPPAIPVAATQSIDLGEGELVVTLSLDADSFMVSEPIYAEIEFRGDPGVEVEMAWMGRNGLGRPSNYALAFVDAGGEARPVPDPGMQFGGQSWTAKVGSEPASQRLFLPNWFVTLEPGDYTLTATTSVEARASEAADAQEVEIALAIPVQVTANDDDRLAALIESVAAAAKGDNWDDSHEAMRRLAAIDDPRTLPHWLELVVIPDYERRFQAIVELATLDDPRALAAVIRASQTQPDELPRDRYTTEELRISSAGQLRVAAIQVLAESDRPEALDAVLAGETDPYDSVRLVACQRAAKVDDARGLAVLKRCTKDPSEMVRGEAKRLLQQRATTP
jgi:hypothetical protein